MVPDCVLLGLIKANPSHGYEMLDLFRSTSDLGRIWTMSTSQVYAVLKRLEKKELIDGKPILGRDAPSRMEYSITKKGEEKLHDWLYEANPSPGIHWIRVVFFSKLYIASLLGMPTDEIIEIQQDVCRKQLNSFTMARKHARVRFEELVLDYVIGQLKTALSSMENLPRTPLIILDTN